MLSNARKRIACALILSVGLSGSLAWPRIASADDTPAVTPLAEGEPAPFTGDLFPPELSLSLGRRVETCEAKAEINERYWQDKHSLALDSEAAKWQARLEAEQARREATDKALTDASAWYRSPLFVASIAVASTLLLGLASVYTYDAISKDLR